MSDDETLPWGLSDAETWDMSDDEAPPPEVQQASAASREDDEGAEDAECDEDAPLAVEMRVFEDHLMFKRVGRFLSAREERVLMVSSMSICSLERVLFFSCWASS